MTVIDATAADIPALLQRGLAALKEGSVGEARNLFLGCSSAAPDCPEAWCGLGLTLEASGDPHGADAAYGEACRLDPGNIDYALHRADIAMACGKAEAEIERISIASDNDPGNPAMIAALAVLLDVCGRRAEAGDLFEVATALAPDHAGLLARYGLSLVGRNRVGEALACFDRAIAQCPRDLSLLNNRAACLLRTNRHREAADLLRALVEEFGPRGGLLCNLANALTSIGRQDEGAAVAWRAIAAEPANPLGWRAACNALPYCEGIGAAELLAVARRTAEAYPRPAAPAAPDRRRGTGQRAAGPLRVGLLSPTLKTHPVGWLTIGAFENLEPTRFAVHCIGAEHPGDAMFRRFRAIAASWLAPDGMDHERLADAIRALDLDALIDLGGYGDQGLLPLCARRLAPVQIKWVGSQSHSTGLAEIDWFISDRWETPPGYERFYSERLLIMPDGYVCYSPPPYAPEVADLPAARNGFVTFGVFNKLAKVTEGCVAAWARILRAVAHSRIVIKCHQLRDDAVREDIVRRFARHGIASGRLDLRGGSPHRDLLAEYGDVDIALDTFPYSGGLTSCEALWMGVPVLALAGESFAARHSVSHLGNAGLVDWVAETPEAYVALACRHAARLDALARLRAGLRARLRDGALCDAVRFGRNLGAALERVCAVHAGEPR